MSNRPRRRLLWECRRWAVMAEYAAYDWPIPDIQTRQDEERWIRTEFRLIQREPLQLHGGMQPDDGLVNIQARNRPDRLNLLENGFPDDLPDSPIRHELIEAFDAAARVFYDALDRLKPLKRVCRQRFDWASWADRAFTDGLWRRPTGKPDPTLFMLEVREEWADYTAPVQWVAKAVAGKDHCLHQHAEEYGPIHAAQTCLQNCSLLSRSLFLPKELLGYWMRVHPRWLDKLKDAEILFLLAANEARQAGECLVALAQAMLEESEAAGIDPVDEKALEQLRGRIAAWERQERHYCAGKLATAKEWLLLGDKEAERKKATEREEKILAETEPATHLAKRISQGGKAGHESTYGTPEEKQHRWATWQQWINEEVQANPKLSFEAIKRIVSAKRKKYVSHSQVSHSQLTRHTKDPRKQK